MTATGADRGQAYLALVAAGVLWGASFLMGKVALDEIGPTWLIAVRFAMASAVLLPLVAWRSGGVRVRMTGRDWALVVVGAALAGPVVFVLQFEGLARTTASSAALLVAVAPPALAVAAALVDGERADRATWTAVALSAAGVVLLVGAPGAGRTLLGDALCVVSMLGAVAWTLLSRRLARRIGALAATAWQFAAGTLLVTALAVVREGAMPAVSLPVWGALTFLGVGCTAITFVLWNWGVLRVEAARAGVIANVEPVVGTALGVGLLGDHLGPLALVGGGLLVAAAFLATRPAAPAAPVPLP